MINELYGFYREIISDKNGNNFISDLIKVCEQKHRIKILEELSKYGYYFDKISLDLHSSDIDNNIETEYEKKFSEQGNKIYYLVAKKDV